MNNLYDTVMDGVKLVNKFPIIMHGVPGMLTRPEAAWLNRIPKVIGGGGRYAELGTFRGRSTCLIADGIKSNNLTGLITTVDCFDNRNISRRFCEDGSIVTQGPEGGVDIRLAGVIAQLKDKGVYDYIEIIKSETAKAAVLFEDSLFDFLFIDADHSYVGVKSDFEAWEPKLKSNGIIAFHDSGRKDIVRFHSEITTWEEFDRINALSVWKRKA